MIIYNIILGMKILSFSKGIRTMAQCRKIHVRVMNMSLFRPMTWRPKIIGATNIIRNQEDYIRSLVWIIEQVEHNI